MGFDPIVFFHKTSFSRDPLEPGERNPWDGVDGYNVVPEPYDDGGATALSAYRWANCGAA